MDGSTLLTSGLGLFVGLVLALTGAGGAIIAVPLLVFGLHLGMAQAGPVGLLAVALAATLGAALGWREGLLRYKAAALMAGAGLLTSPPGLWLAQRIPNAPLTVLFALVLGAVAWRMFAQASRELRGGSRPRGSMRRHASSTLSRESCTGTGPAPGRCCWPVAQRVFCRVCWGSAGASCWCPHYWLRAICP